MADKLFHALIYFHPGLTTIETLVSKTDYTVNGQTEHPAKQAMINGSQQH